MQSAYLVNKEMSFEYIESYRLIVLHNKAAFILSSLTSSGSHRREVVTAEGEDVLLGDNSIRSFITLFCSLHGYSETWMLDIKNK